MQEVEQFAAGCLFPATPRSKTRLEKGQRELALDGLLFDEGVERAQIRAGVEGLR